MRILRGSFCALGFLGLLWLKRGGVGGNLTPGSLAGPAFGNLEDAVHLHILQDIGAAADPADLDTVDARPLAQAKMWIHPVVALVPATAVDLIDLG